MSDNGLNLRQKYISQPALNLVRDMLPRMSETEREALNAGTVWWDAELLSGNPDWNKLFALETHRLSTEEQAFLEGPCDDLCAMIDDWDITFNKRDIPDNVWAFVKKHGFLGLIIDKKYGGKGFSASMVSAIVQKIASRGPSAAVTVIVPNSLGPGELLTLFGTETQKDHYLPRLADGRDIPAFALTSVDAGSDAAAMTDNGIVCYGTYKGKKTLGIRVNWSKRYISLGPVATVLGLAFKLYDPDKLLGDDHEPGITVALVPTDTKGVSIGRRHYPSHQAFPNGPNSGKDVFIPMDWIIGGQERIGQGWRMLVTALSAGRGIMLPSMGLAAMKLASRSTSAYARIREQFNIPIGKFEGVQEPLARILGQTYMIDSASRVTTDAIDAGEKPAIISAIMKYHATERMRDAIDDAMDIHGGRAVCDGPNNYLGSAYRGTPIAITVEGANIMTRSLMIYGQGSIRCHPFIEREVYAAQNEDQIQGVKEFDSVLFKHAWFQLKTTGLAFYRGWTRALFSSTPIEGHTANYYKQIKRLSSALTLISESSLVTLGGQLKRKELLSARLGDVLSELYLSSCVLKRFEDDGAPPEDLPLVHWACHTSLHEAERGLRGLVSNFPLRPIAWILRFITLPFGHGVPPPSDDLINEVAELIQKPGPARERLTEGIYIGDKDDILGRVEYAFTQVTGVAMLKRKMRQARIKDIEEALAKEVITSDEAERLHEVQALVRDVLQVDDFSLEELTGRKPAKPVRKPKRRKLSPAKP
ncbi:MAG: acyl-CoA dehydrogenase [Hyphomicrobiales bacterium]